MEQLKNKEKVKRGEDDYEKDDEYTGVIIRAGDVIRFGRVCYLIKESSADIEKRALNEISQRFQKR